MRARLRPAVGLVLLAVATGGCTSTTSSAPTTSTRVTSRAPVPAAPTTGPTGCPVISASGGPVTSQVVVVTTSSATAAAGSVLAVRTEVVVLSDAPDVVARPQWSTLEVLTQDGVVARAVGSAGADVPTALHRGTTVAAPTVPTAITLTGCDGRPLVPGAYFLRASVGYASASSTGATTGFVMRSEPVDLTVT